MIIKNNFVLLLIMIINKVLSLERGNSPALKQIPLPWDAIIAGGSQIINGVIGAGNTSSSNKTNLKIAQMNNDAMLKANRQNNDWSRNTAIEMFNLENAYNDPSAIKARLEAAGLNPSVVMGQNNPMVSGSVDTPQAQPVPAFQQAQVTPVPSPFVGVFDAIEKYASAISNISAAKQKDAEAKVALEKLQPEIDKIWSEVNSNNAKALYDNTMSVLTQLKAPYEVKLMISNAALNASKGEEAQATAGLRKAERMLANSKNSEIKLQLPFIQENARKTINLLAEQAKTERSKQAANYAESNLLASQKTEQDYFNTLRNNPEVRASLVMEAKQRGEQAQKNNMITAKQLEQMNYLVSQAAYADDMKEFTYWSGQVNQFVGTLGDAVSSFYGAGALKQLMELRKFQSTPPNRVSGFNRN